MRAWRIVQAAYVDDALSGEGARRFGGRWNSVGTAVAYLAPSLSLAVLELLPRLADADGVRGYRALRVEIDGGDDLAEDLGTLPADWHQVPPGPSTQALGDAWIRAGTSLLLRVPSAMLPAESNLLLNPRHPDAARVRVGAPERLDLDPRLLRP